MGIGSFFTTLLSTLAGFFGWLQQGQLLDAGEARATARNLETQVKDIEQAIEIREEIRSLNSSVSQSDSLPDDGFRRD